MAKEIAKHRNKKVVERQIRGKRVMAVEGDDAGIPYEITNGRVYSPLFPYQSFKTKAELGKQVLKENIHIKRRPDPTG